MYVTIEMAGVEKGKRGSTYSSACSIRKLYPEIHKSWRMYNLGTWAENETGVKRVCFERNQRRRRAR